MKTLFKSAIFFLSMIFITQLHAQVGYLDPTFGDGGIVVQKRLGYSVGLAVLPDGKILVPSLGEIFTIDRFNPDGSNDITFGVNGRVELNLNNKFADCQGMAVQNDGKIILVGYIVMNNPYRDIAVVRCKSDGSLDSSFGINGLATFDLNNYDYADDVVIQPDGKLVITGNFYSSSGQSYDSYILRLMEDGSKDLTFGDEGFFKVHYPVITYNSSVLLQPDGKILMGGTYNTYGGKPDFMVERLNADGSVDNSFGENGTAKYKFGEGQAPGWLNNFNDMALQPDGKIVMVGQAGLDIPSMAICRFNADGSVDEGFGEGGGFFYVYNGHWSVFNAVCIQPDNKILATGASIIIGGPLLLFRFNNDGSLDQSFAIGGIQATFYGDGASGHDLTILPDQKILVAGSVDAAQNLLARYNGDNILATNFKNVQAIQDIESVTISWQTLNESGTKNYSIERSSNATDFTSIATVPAKGGQENSYSYTDHHPLEGTSYYRIKENALNGTATFSNTLKVIFESNTISLYPNPAKNTITITGLNKQYNATIRITDMHGRELLNQKINNSSNITLPIRALAQGSYFVIIEQNGKVEKLRFVKE